MTDYFTSSDQIRIAFTRRGTGPAVIFLHGWMCNRSFWTDQIAALSSKYTCIAVDLPGHGESDVPEAPCTMALLARSVRELIEHLGISECVLVGHSMSGMVAQMLAVEGVPSMSALVLVTTIASAATEQLISKRIARDAESGSFVEAFDKHVSGWFSADVEPATRAHAQQQMLKTPDAVALALVTDYWNFDFTGQLATINIPTLVIGGRGDNSTPASQSRQLARHIPDARLHIMDCGHFPMFERSDELTAVLAEFLDSHTGPLTRIEHDLLGEVPVPAAALYGAHTQRAVDNFPLAGEKRIGDYPALIDALMLIKLSAATTNRNIGALDAKIADAIVAGARQLLASPRYDQFPIHRFHGGGGTSANMNANEVLANVAELAHGGQPGQYNLVHPNDHVNLNQSTNDVYPTACHVAIIMNCPLLAQTLDALALSLRKKGDELGDQPRLARTCLQDAVDTTYSDLFNAYASCIERLRSRLHTAVDRLHSVNLGGTIVGRQADAPSAYRRQVVPALCQATGDDQYTQATDLFDAAQNLDDMIAVSSALEILARTLIKICKDLRLLSSGPEGGLAEIHLPPAQGGSSIMPGKVNPVIPEFVVQICFQVIGHHAACASTLDHGELDLNIWESSIVFNILDSFESLTSATQTLTDRAIAGISIDAQRSNTHADSTIPLLTRLAREHGYARISKLCGESGGDLQQLKQNLHKQGLLPSVD